MKESVVEAGFSFASENKDDEDDDVTFERVVDDKGNITFQSSSKETVTGSSSVSITYDEETNTFTSESVTTSSQTISGLVVGSEAPKNDTDIILRLIQNQKRLNYFIDLYSRPTYTGDREEKIAEAKNYIKQLKNFENNPGPGNVFPIKVLVVCQSRPFSKPLSSFLVSKATKSEHCLPAGLII